MFKFTIKTSYQKRTDILQAFTDYECLAKKRESYGALLARVTRETAKPRLVKSVRERKAGPAIMKARSVCDIEQFR
jgi:hypothetical protein